MLKRFVLFALCCLSSLPLAAQLSDNNNGWREKVATAMPLLGHRNWILIVDSAYPLQSSSGVETIETNSSQIEVTRFVLNSIHHSIHVRPLVYMDAELPFVSDQDAPGASAYRSDIKSMLKEFPLESIPHDQLIAQIAQAGTQFQVLVLKTNITIPYTSVFIRLDCKYWSADAEKRLRDKMKAAPSRIGQP